MKFEVRGAHEESRRSRRYFFILPSHLELRTSWSHYSDDTDSTSNPPKPVPESYIRRHRMSRLEVGIDDPLPVHAQLRDHAAARIDERGDAGRPRAKEVATARHRAHAGLMELLP